MNPNTAKLSLEKLFADQGKNFRRVVGDEAMPSYPAGVHQVVIEELETHTIWCAKYCTGEDDNPDYCRALEWKPAKKIVVEKWVAADST